MFAVSDGVMRKFWNTAARLKKTEQIRFDWTGVALAGGRGLHMRDRRQF